MNQFKTQPALLALAIGAALGGVQAAQAADSNPFQLHELSQDYMVVADNTTAEDKHGKEEKKSATAEDDKAKEGKCGEGKCGKMKQPTTPDDDKAKKSN